MPESTLTRTENQKSAIPTKDSSERQIRQATPIGPVAEIMGLHESLGNRAVRQVLQPKNKSCVIPSFNAHFKIPSSSKASVIQLQTDATPPEEILEERRKAGFSGNIEQSGVTKEISDDGKGVASIESGLPWSTPTATKTNEEEENASVLKVQAKATHQLISKNKKVSPGVVLNKLGSGLPMNRHLRENMEGSFGESFHNVKIHTGRQTDMLSASLGAQAFTIGNNLAFAAGRYQPDTTDGKKLIAHELTHVIQQRRGVSGDILQNGIGHPGDQYEIEADRMAAQTISRADQRSGAAPSVKTRQATATTGNGRSEKNIIQLFSGSNAAAYARRWAFGTNPEYGRFGNDCTNFVSQAMRAGGWWREIGNGYCAHRKKDHVWWFERNGCTVGWCPPVVGCVYTKAINASYTWGGAENFRRFVQKSSRGTLAKHVQDLKIGDVLQMDFNRSGTINHTMIVTKKTDNNLYLTYHTGDHLDEPFWSEGGKQGIQSRNKDADYYGWKI